MLLFETVSHKFGIIFILFVNPIAVFLWFRMTYGFLSCCQSGKNPGNESSKARFEMILTSIDHIVQFLYKSAYAALLK